ncbi:MAG: hypothetical protein WAO98_05335 [Alphaproteobacteria bacterium]
MSKKSQKPKIAKYTRGISPTKERHNQNCGVISEPIHEKNGYQTYTRRHRAMFECSLDAYLWFNQIDEAEYAAGMKFRRAYLCYICKVRVDDYGSGSHGDPEMAALMPVISEKILTEAYEVLTKKQKTLIINVCGINLRAGSGGNNFALFKRGLERMAKRWSLT